MEPLNKFEENLLKEKAYMHFLNTIQSQETLRIYRYSILKYMAFQGFKSTDEMLEGDPKKIEEDIAAFATKRTVNKRTMLNYIQTLKKFYVANRKSLSWEWIKSHNTGEYRKNNDKPYTKEQIATILKSCDLRTRALVLLLASTGVRIGAVPELKMKHLKKIDEYGMYRITVYEGANEEYITFTTPEARKALDEYFEYRERAGEQFTPKSPIIRDKIDINDPIKVRHPREMKLDGISKTLYDLILRSGVKKARKVGENGKQGAIRHETATAHGFRKFATSAMMDSEGINAVDADTLLGHRVGLMHVYHKPTEAKLLAEYMKAVDALTIDPKNALEKKVKELESIKDEQIRNLTSRLNDVENRYLDMSRLFLDKMMPEGMKTIENERQITKEELQRMMEEAGP